MELQHGATGGSTLQPARCHDRLSPYGIEDLPAGSLQLADLGYFGLEEWQAKQALGHYFVRCYKMRTEVLTWAGEPLDLLGWVSQVETVGECGVLWGQQARLPGRLVVFRVSEASAARARQRLYAYARKKGGTPLSRALVLADWVVLITHGLEALLSAREMWVLARVRWQVEILFRVWQSGFRVDACRRRNLWRVLCALYAKWMGLVVWHWLLLVCRGGVGDRSLYQASCAFRRLSVVLCVCLRFGCGLEGVWGGV